MNLLITGGCGFIGSNIAQNFLENNYFNHITIIDNLSTGFLSNIEPLLKLYSKLTYVHGDITDLEICRKVTQNIDVICHQAATGSVPRSINDPYFYNNNNVNGFFNLIVAAKENGVKRFVYASSSSVYGDETVLPKIENKTGNLLSPYAATKKINEIYANVFTKCYGMECIGLRYFNIFGPKQNPNGEYAAVIPKFIQMVQNDQSPTINGNGEYSRDFTYIDNVIQANYLALTTKNSECFGEVFNIGSEGRVTINQLYFSICAILGKKIDPIYGPLRNGDIPHSNANINKAKELLGYNPIYDFKRGIEKTVNFFTKNNVVEVEAPI